MKSSLLTKTCDRCGRELALGSTKYQFHLEVQADWDGYLPPSEGDVDFSETLKEAAQLDQETLEDQVHLEINMLICPKCRAEILKSVDAGPGASSAKPKTRERLQ